MGHTPQPSKRKITHGLEERMKMTRLRVTIARRLKEAQNNAAMLTTFNEVDMKNIIQMRKDYQEDFQRKYTVKLGFMSFFVKASIVALKKGEAGFVVGNILGSNIINILLVLGASITISNIPIDFSSVKLSIYFLIVSTLIFIFILLNQKPISRVYGILLLIIYCL